MDIPSNHINICRCKNTKQHVFGYLQQKKLLHVNVNNNHNHDLEYDYHQRYPCIMDNRQEKEIKLSMKWNKILNPLLLCDTSEDEAAGLKNEKFAVIILNHCFDNLIGNIDLSSKKDTDQSLNDFINSNKFKLFKNLWNNSQICFSVDGGTNTFFEFQKSTTNDNDNSMLIKDPNFITGDFDSIRNDVMEHYKRKSNVKIVPTPDQNYTDFTKSLMTLKDEIQHSHISLNSTFVFYSSFGRIDQYLSIISTAHKFIKDKTFPPVILIDLASSITFVLNQGLHQIPTIKKAKWCSLIPLCGPVKLKTTGFRWNLSHDDDGLEFGKFVSSSNEFDPDSEFVTVEIKESSKQLLFSSDF